MIYYYEHKPMSDMPAEEINLLGFNGIKDYSLKHGIDPQTVFDVIKQLENDIKNLNQSQIDITSPEHFELLNKWVNFYIEYFNRFATFKKQAYIIIGNIASGKSTFAKEIEETTKSIIVDPDKFKMGEQTDSGFFEGLTSLYQKPTDRELMQDACSTACKMTLENISNLGMNLIMPKAATSLEKLERQLKRLQEKNYDIHLILIDAPISDCADRNYYRYLIKEYEGSSFPTPSSKTHGRFVPVSVITNIGDSPYETFIRALKSNNGFRFKSFNAFYNSNSQKNEEIDIKTMQ